MHNGLLRLRRLKLGPLLISNCKATRSEIEMAEQRIVTLKLVHAILQRHAQVIAGPGHFGWLGSSHVFLTQAVSVLPPSSWGILQLIGLAGFACFSIPGLHTFLLLLCVCSRSRDQ